MGVGGGLRLALFRFDRRGRYGYLGVGGGPGGGMAHIQRLIWVAFGVVFVAFPMLASSAEQYRTNAHDATIAGSALASCQAWAAISGYDGPYLAGIWENPSGNPETWFHSGFLCRSTAYPSASFVIAVRGVQQCPNGRDSATGVCLECPDGQELNGSGQCVPICEAPKFTNWLGVCVDPCPAAGTDPARLNVNGGNPVCSGGCEKRATRCALRIDVGGIQTGSLKICDYVSSGNQCDWSGERAGEDEGPDLPDPEPDPQSDPCPSGQQRGKYNGQDICVKTGDTTDVKKDETDTTETTNPDGSKTTTETRTETRIEYNSTTNTTTTTTTTTTTNTIRDSSGNVTDTNTTITVGQKQTNGNNVDTEDNAGGGGGDEAGGVFAGTCGLEPYCEGDAIQCAIAAATFKSQCALVVAPDVMSEWQQIVEFDGTQEGAGLDRKTIDVPQTLNVTMTGGGVGLVDQSFVVAGKTIVLPFSWINPYLDMFGAAMLAIAWIMAFGIIRSAI